MQIIDFSKDLIPAAIRLIWENYEDERAVVPTLPDLDTMPPLDELAENGLGAAAVESGVFLGFLSAYGPWGPVFTTQANGVFSPIHAHAAQKEKRVAIYQRLYQAAGEKWMRQALPAMRSRSLPMTRMHRQRSISTALVCGAWILSVP